MKRCPNPECTVMATADGPAEFPDRLETCPDCGAVLVEADLAASPAAVPSLTGARGRFSTTAPVLATLAVVALVATLSATGIPGAIVQADEYVRTARGLLNLPEREWTFLAVGIRPFLFAFAGVELLALIIPSWRARRVHPDRRAPLTRTALGLGAIVAFVQLSAMESVLHGMLGPVDDVPGALATLAVVGGVALSLAAVWVLKRGPSIGNPFSVVILASTVVDLGCAFLAVIVDVRTGALAPASLLLVGGGIAASVAVGYFGVGTDFGRESVRHPVPGSGLLALWLPTSALSLLASAWALLAVESGFANTLWALLGNRSVSISVSGVAALLLTWVFYRPALVERAWSALGVPDAGGASRRAFSVAMKHAVLFTVAAAVAGALLTANLWNTVWLTTMTLIVVTAIVKDLVREWRFAREHGALASAFSVQRLYLVEPALDVLREAGIDAYPRGLHHRSLELIFAPYVPVELLVPAGQAAAARRLLDARWPGA